MTLIDPLTPQLPIGPYMPPWEPLNNVTPLTYRDGKTYLRQLELLAKFVNETLVIFINQNFTELGEKFQTQVTALIESVNAHIDEQTAAVNAQLAAQDEAATEQLANQNALVTQHVTDLTNFVNDAVASIINSTIVVSDPVVKGILDDLTSATRVTINGYISTAMTTEVARSNAAYAPRSGNGMVVSKNGKVLRTVAGVIRNDGAPTYWQPIIDGPTGHQGDLNVDTVVTTGGEIQINYPGIGATKIVSFVAVTDDTLAQSGYFVGTSVGLTQTRIRLSKIDQEYSDYVFYDAVNAVWKSTRNAGITLAYAAGRLTITHPAIDASKLYKQSAVGRGGYNVAVGSSSVTSMSIEFRNAAGTLLTVPDANMLALVSHGGGLVTDVNVQALDQVSVPGSNIWFYGVFEVNPGNLS